MTLFVNFVLFQIGWFACVLGAAHGLPWIGALAAAAIIGLHLARATQPKLELALVAAAAVLGALFETFLVQAGWVRFETGVLFEDMAPYWMVALWAIFATTLNVSLRSLRPHLGLAALLGAAGGPAAYYAGARLGALELPAAGIALGAIGIGWAILTPALLRAARRLDGYAQP
ncbi:MAG: DUF2878 domain-containing protein [Betaproteobacteria bacterium]|nr:DUF2878 domain-containing protein [Betaproteobacteria bacterium]